MEKSATAQNPGKIMIHAALLVIFFVVTVAMGIVWLNNAKASIDWHSLPASEKPSLTPNLDGQTEGVDQNGVTVKRKEVHGFIKSLDWTLVDYSTAATLIPFYGMALILISLSWIGRNKQEKIGQRFAFSMKSDMIIVNLGLIGTVWGFIMIGFYDPNTINMPQLIMCLNTAMFSTLLALIWVFEIQPAFIIPLLNRWNRSCNGLAEIEAVEDGDVEEMLKRFSKVLGESTSALVVFRGEYGKLKTEFSGLLAELKSSKAELHSFIESTVAPICEQIMVSMQAMVTASKDSIEASKKQDANAVRQAEIALKQSEAITVLDKHLTATYGTVAKLETDLASRNQLAVTLEQQNEELRQALEVIKSHANVPPRKNR